jgi:hypothetical protein
MVKLDRTEREQDDLNDMIMLYYQMMGDKDGMESRD